MKKIRSFLLNIVILTATTLLVRFIGVSFNVYLSNKIGASGIGLYQLILSVYTLSITFASSGINLTTTRLVVEELGRGNDAGAKRVVRRCLSYGIFFGTVTAMVLFFNAEYISLHWLGDIRPLLSLKVLAISLPFIAMSSALNGYFTAVRRVVKFASAQIFEQFVKIILTVIGLTLLLPKGLEYACVAIVAASCLSELTSFLFLFLLYKLDIRRYRAGGKSTPHIIRRLLGIAIPDAVSSYARSILLTIEHMLIPVGFRKSGASSESALASYGMIHGMVLPIITFPSALLNALSSLLIPEIAECHLHKKTVQTNYIITRVLRITLMFAMGTMGILFSFSNELGLAIYKSAETGSFIKVLAPLVPVMYMDTTVDGMLKGLGQQVSSMRYNIIDSSLCVVLVYILLPKFAINGYIVVLFVSEILNFFLSIRRLSIVASFQINFYVSVVKPIFCIVGSVSMAKLFFLLTGLGFSSVALNMTLHITVTLLIYLAYLYALSCITHEDLTWFSSIFKK